MKRILPVILAVVAGCVSEPSPRGGDDAKREPSPAEREVMKEVREAFGDLHRAWMSGDALAALNIMSVQGMSDWILKRSRDGSDAEFPKLLKALDAPRKVDFEHWVRSNKDTDFTGKRSEILPESILTSQWLVNTWKAFFEPEKANLAAIARDVEVGEVWVDGTEASVFVKMNSTPAMIYSMLLENGKWKFDFNVKPANSRR